MSKKRSAHSNGGWAWKPPYARDDIYTRGPYRGKLSAKAEKRLRKRLARLRGDPTAAHPFYDSDRWKQLRYRILRRDGAKCVVCGRGAKQGVILQVDHIKPRSLYPALEWAEDNLQVMCRDCNQGKSNTDTRDWR